MNPTIRKIFEFLFVSFAFVVAAIALLAIGVYGAIMVVWMHAPVFEVSVLCLLFCIPLLAIVLMLKSIGFSLLQKINS